MKEKELISCISLNIALHHIYQLMDPDRGVAVIPLGGPKNELIELLCRLAQDLPYYKAKTTTTKVEQNFSSFGEFDSESPWVALADKIAVEIYGGFASLHCIKMINMPLKFTDLALQYYEPSRIGEKYGISPHRDQSGYINLVVVLLLFGPSSFFVCKDKSAQGAREIEAMPGDLMIMRGGGFCKGLTRPHHFVGRIDDPKGRLSFGMRQMTDDPEEAKRIRMIFSGENK